MTSDPKEHTKFVHEHCGGMKLKDSCAYLGGISQVTLRRLIKRGLIKPNRALRHIIISKAELDRFLAN